MKFNLENKVALVTGGSRGIGRSICTELARAGAAVVFSYRSNASAAEQTQKDIERAGGICRAVEGDVADLGAAETLVGELIRDYGRLDILVNNAGVTRDQLLARMKPEDFDAVIQTNLRGTWNLCRAVVRPMMKARAGRIINISSVVAQMGNAGQSNYAASKGGVEALTRALSRELGSRQITVNAIAPGMIETEMTAGMTADQRALLGAQIPLGRLGTVEDVAHAVCFLASNEGSYITGQVLAVNGGLG